MRIGVWLDDTGRTLDELIGEAAAAEERGLDSVWLGQRDGWDPLTALAVIGREVPRIGLGTAIVRTYPQHPLVLASQALSVQAATGGRLTLGLGASFKPLIETQYGLAFDRPARHVRDYLSILIPLLGGEAVSYAGELVGAQGSVTVPGATPPPVLLAAHLPAMIRNAGELADGLVSTWAVRSSLEEHLIPRVREAASGAGRPEPRVLASVLVSVTNEPSRVRSWVAETYGAAATFPGYRDTLDRGGANGVEDTVVAGDEQTVEASLHGLAGTGLTDLVAIPIGSAAERASTYDVLARTARPGRTAG